MSKQCHRCKEWKDESEFHKSKTNKGGLRHYCKKCSLILNKLSPKRLESSLNTALAKLDYLEFQQIHGAYTCICKHCGEIKPRHKIKSKKEITGFMYYWVCHDCYKKNFNSKIKYRSSEYKGVKKVNSYFRANIKVNKKIISIGSYKTEIEAAKAFNDYIIEHKLDRKLNIIPEGA